MGWISGQNMVRLTWYEMTPKLGGEITQVGKNHSRPLGLLVFHISHLPEEAPCNDGKRVEPTSSPSGTVSVIIHSKHVALQITKALRNFTKCKQKTALVSILSDAKRLSTGRNQRDKNTLM